MPPKNNNKRSKCCNAPIVVAHGCDSDFGHGNKKCDCAKKGGVTCWYACTKCEKPCTPVPVREETKVEMFPKRPHVGKTYANKILDSVFKNPPSEEGWEKEFDSRFPPALKPLIDRELQERVEILFGKDSEYFGAIKDFIRSLLASTEARVKREVVEIIKSNSKGAFTDDVGNDCWYTDDLISLIESK